MQVDKNEPIRMKEKTMIGMPIGLLKRPISFLLRITFKRQAVKRHKKSNSEGEKRGRLRSPGIWLIRGRVNIKTEMANSVKKKEKRMINKNPKSVRGFFEKVEKEKRK